MSHSRPSLAAAFHANRRSFILGGASLTVLPFLQRMTYGRVVTAAKFDLNPFTLGVASGDPSPDGVVLWTRLAPRPIEGGGMAPDIYEVGWEVATDDKMKNVVQQGVEFAQLRSSAIRFTSSFPG